MQATREHIVTEGDVSWTYSAFTAPAFGVVWHYHPEIELTLITQGAGTRIVGDSVETYRPGDLALIGPDLPHTYISGLDSGPQSAVVIQFRRDFLGDGWLSRPEFEPILRLIDDATHGVTLDPRADVRDTLLALPTRDPLDRTMALIRLLDHLADDGHRRTLATPHSGHRLPAPARRRIDAACSYVQASYTDPGAVGLTSVAAAAHMTPAAFSRFFRRAMGRTLTDYVTELRLANACRLLADSDLPVVDVAIRSGYGNLSNFNRQFRARKEMTPREYRRLIALRHGAPSPSTRP